MLVAPLSPPINLPGGKRKGALWNNSRPFMMCSGLFCCPGGENQFNPLRIASGFPVRERSLPSPAPLLRKPLGFDVRGSRPSFLPGTGARGGGPSNCNPEMLVRRSASTPRLAAL